MTVIGLSNQLIVPITVWGSQSPTHCISSILLTNDNKTVVTGCNDGQICLWDVSHDKLMLTPRSLLFGHTSPVLCLANGKQLADNSLLISSSEAGEMSSWDLSDGRCLESVKLQYVHTNIQTYQLSTHEEMRLFCNGYYAEILVMDVTTLEVLYTLTSKVNPDWISAMHVLRPAKRQAEDVVIGLSIAGVVKVWTLTGHESRTSEPVYEDESKPIRCLNALKLTCCIYNQRTVLVVCTKYWQIYDAGDFSLLCSVDSRRGERWSGGDFITADRVIVWSDSGKGYLYKLPINCIPDNKEFHSPESDQPFMYCILSIPNDERLLCPPAINFYLLNRNVNESGNPPIIQKLLIRGDSYGKVAIWSIPEVSNKDLSSVQQESIANPPQLSPTVIQSLEKAWKVMKPSPCGILDHLIHHSEDTPYYKLTASVYLPMQGRLVCGREDGSIIIVSASQTIMLQFLIGKHLTFEDWPHHQILVGHSGRVNCLLYPHHINNRYDIAHLVSGGVDFSVCLWDIYAGTLLHRFSVHAGEINQLFAPPKECNPRVLQCVCSVASDHSVALISLKERKCVMLASRHLFPIHTIKWRPLDDFMIVGCVDGSVYVWQMETGHLDRVLHGIIAEEILSACDENITTTGDRLTNPAIHLFRGLRHRNLAAIRHAAVRGLHNISSHLQQQRHDVIDMSIRSRSHPLMIQGLRTNPKDQDSHVLFFDVEALIVQLLSEEYSALTPNTLEAQGLTNNAEYQKYQNLSCSPETQHKLSGFLSKVKDTAENAAQKIQAKAESVGFKNVSGDISVGFYRKGSTASTDESRTGGSTPTTTGIKKPAKLNVGETNLTMDIAQLLLSLLHAWGLDTDLDKVCESKLGLLRPLRPVCFGMISRGGHMSLILPTYMHKLDATSQSQNDTNKPIAQMTKIEGKHVKIASFLSPECVVEEEKARRFASRLHWELSTAITTNHLLSIISLANTLMSMSSATFIPEHERRKKLNRRASRSDSRGESDSENKSSEAEQYANHQQQIKQGWSLLAALHCVLLPDLVKSSRFKRPLVEILGRRWQDRCLEVREAAQALLLAELRRIGTKGRKQIVDDWAPYLPNYSDGTHSSGHHSQSHSQPHSITSSPSPSPVPSDSGGTLYKHSDLRGVHDDNSDEDDDADEHSVGVDGSGGGGGADDSNATRYSSSGTSEGRRKQATAIVLLGVIGSEYGHEVEQSKRKPNDETRRKSVIEGFGPGNYTLARNTSKALAYLLLAPPSPSLPLHTSLRRAAIDLIGRGFTVWEPYLDVSKILLGLLELCCDSEKLVPSMSFGLPLTPAADSCRTARHAISLIATARPPAFITTLAKEVARYNTLQQNAQSLNIALHQTVLCRGRPEILRNMEILIDKMQTDVADLIIEAMDIIIHCLDHNMLKTKGLGEVFPAVSRFQNVTYCTSSRRIAVGAKNGNLAIYELRAPKSQVIPAHSSTITACSFSPDGKHLVSYSAGENKVSFWLTAVGLFGLGNAQTRCVKSYSSPPMPEHVRATGPLKMARFIWVSNKSVILMFSDGNEFRFNV